MKKTFIAGAMLGALAANSAMAADLEVKAPIMRAPPVPVYSWTGCYLDAGVGYGMWNQDHSITDTVGFTTIETTNGGRGWLGRFGAGCDYQVSSSWLIGLYGDYDWMNLKGSMATLLTNAGFAVSADENESAAWAVGGRIGYLITPSVLTYVGGGWTETTFDQMNAVRANGVAFGNVFPAHTYQGWFIDSGVEYAFTWLPINGLFVRSNYRYSTYQKDDITATNGNVLHASKQVQTVTTSLVWRFNWGH
jgi:outer membrane immunogenic protein